MSEALLFIFSLSSYLLDVFLYYWLLNNKLTFRFSKHYMIPSFIISYVFMLLVSYSNALFPNLPLKLVFFFLFYLSLYITYSDAIFKKILWIIIATFTQITSEIISMIIIPLITNTSFINITSNVNIKVIGIVLSRIIWSIIIMLLTKTNRKIALDFTKDMFLIILTDVIYTLTITSMFYYNNVFLSVDVAIALSVFAILIISVLALYLLRKITKKSDEIMMTNLKMQQIEMEHKQNQDMAIVVDDLRALRHDMNNHMAVLQGLLTMKAYDDAQSYLSNITEELSIANSFIFTDNKVLSVMLNNKISKAKQLGITFDTEVVTSTTPFSDSDLCAVIGNILENAIEASSKHINPYILFSMKKSNENLIIECENNYTVTPVFEKGNLITTKSDKAYHGIGTKTIRSVVEEYHGTTEFIVDELFHVKIAVPIV